MIPSPSALGIEHIFSPAEAGEDLFGRTEAPRLEIVAEPPVPAPEPQQAAFSPSPWPPVEATAAPPSSVDPSAQDNATNPPPPDAPPAWPAGAVMETLAPPPVELPPPEETPLGLDSAPIAGPRSRQRTEQKAPWFVLLVFCPLLLYAIVISIFAFLLYREYEALQEHQRAPFDALPDVGDDPGVHKGKKVSRIDRFPAELATRELPERLCTTLGHSVRIGDLEVTPNRVERRRVSVIVGKSEPEPCSNDSLVLYLDLKNLSNEHAFAPLDNYFDRSWRPAQGLTPPLTQLEIGHTYRCYGGPAHWSPRGERSRNQRQWVKGRSDQGEFLQPGQEKQMFVCTNGDDAEAAAVLFGDKADEAYHGSFLWHVRVRRGLVRIQGKDYPATAVVGVRFTEQDIVEAAR